MDDDMDDTGLPEGYGVWQPEPWVLENDSRRKIADNDVWKTVLEETHNIAVSATLGSSRADLVTSKQRIQAMLAVVKSVANPRFKEIDLEARKDLWEWLEVGMDLGDVDENLRLKLLADVLSRRLNAARRERRKELDDDFVEPKVPGETEGESDESSSATGGSENQTSEASDDVQAPKTPSPQKKRKASRRGNDTESYDEDATPNPSKYETPKSPGTPSKKVKRETESRGTLQLSPGNGLDTGKSGRLLGVYVANLKDTNREVWFRKIRPLFNVLLDAATVKQFLTSLNSWLGFVEMVPPPEALLPGEPEELAVLWNCLQKSIPLDGALRGDGRSRWYAYKWHMESWAAYYAAEKTINSPETNRMLMNHRKELTGDEKLPRGGKEKNSFFSYCVHRFWGLRVSKVNTDVAKAQYEANAKKFGRHLTKGRNLQIIYRYAGDLGLLMLAYGGGQQSDLESINPDTLRDCCKQFFEHDRDWQLAVETVRRYIVHDVLKGSTPLNKTLEDRFKMICMEDDENLGNLADVFRPPNDEGGDLAPSAG